MKLFSKLFGAKKATDSKPVIVVSGLPRSGTSMMMKMLEAGGIPVMTDNIRTADDDNPKGYYEFERVKQLDTDTAWLSDAQGKVVKVISMLLEKLPGGYEYKVIFMRRNIEEILASQRQMLVRRGEETDKVPDEEMARMYAAHLEKIGSWLAGRDNMDLLYVEYSDVIGNVQSWSNRINTFLGGDLDIEKMNGVVDGSLYRQRAQ
jgi:hypothetical protein